MFVFLFLCTATLAKESNKKCISDYLAGSREVTFEACSVHAELEACKASLATCQSIAVIVEGLREDYNLSPFVYSPDTSKLDDFLIGLKTRIEETYGWGSDILRKFKLFYKFRDLTWPIDNADHLRGALALKATQQSHLDIYVEPAKTDPPTRSPSTTPAPTDKPVNPYDTPATGAYAKSGYEVIFWYHDVMNVDDIPDDMNAIANGFKRDNAFYMGNDKLKEMKMKNPQFCVEKFGDWGNYQLCQDITGSGWEAGRESGCATRFNSVDTVQKKVIVAITGQCSSNQYLRILPAIDCNPEEYQRNDGPRCWTCHNYGGNAKGMVLEGGGAEWHIQGCGLTMSIDGNERVMPGREVGPYNPKIGMCQCKSVLPWDVFYVRAEVG